MKAPPTPEERRRRCVVALLVVHAVTLTALYGAAVVAGGGFAGDPMPLQAWPADRPIEADTDARDRVSAPKRDAAGLRPADVPEWLARIAPDPGADRSRGDR